MANKSNQAAGAATGTGRSNTAKGLRSAIRRDYMASPDRLMNQLNANRKGKRTMITMENPNKEETNKQFITVEGKSWFKAASAPERTKA